MLNEDTNCGVHQVPYAEHDLGRSSEQDPSVSFVLNPSLKSADDTRSSISSDKSDSKPPRSAMRRTSSISKFPQSPRRVRFDFMGEEVLPTSSPQQTAFIADRISSPEPADHEASFTSNLASDSGEDEEETPSRKVSSSDALRALSRAPLDEDGTVWTVVNSDSEDSTTDEVKLTQSDQPEIPNASPSSAAPTLAGFAVETNTPRSQAGSKATFFNSAALSSNKPEDDSTDDEDMLSMAKHKSPLPSSSSSSSCASKAPFMQAFPNSEGKAVLSAAGEDITGPSTTKQTNLIRGETIPRAPLCQGEEDMFYFEEDGLESIRGASKDGPEKRKEEKEEEEEEEEHSDDGIDTEAAMPTSLYATSPAINIPLPKRTVEGQPIGSSTSSKVKFNSDTVGSYKGRPLMMSVLRNPEILNEIDSLVPLEPVVGKPLDERLASARSFSERLVLEDIMEAAKGNLKKSGLRQL